ncbi:MAG TPA: hypothetical protein VLE19_10025 [Pyrinomonadaceae bacterium]|nr:hypothetical protein [Pyrinomonadaceae bacterium]
MNRYLLRSLVAISTCVIGIAVTAVFHPFESRRWERRYPNYQYRDRHCPRSAVSPVGSLSIDAAATDPVKLLYSQTRPMQGDFKRQTVDFLLDNRTARTISKVMVGYRSAWMSNTHGGGGGLTASFEAGAATNQTVSIDCDTDETLWVWISAVEFKDGSRWNNPRHSDTQQF